MDAGVGVAFWVLKCFGWWTLWMIVYDDIQGCSFKASHPAFRDDGYKYGLDTSFGFDES